MRYRGSFNYSKLDFLDAYNEVTIRTAQLKTILYAWEKAGLWPYGPRTVFERIEAIEGPRRTIPEEIATPEPNEFGIPSPQEIDWSIVETPDCSLTSL